MKPVASIALLLAALGAPAAASAGEILSGHARVIEGDTLVVGGKVVGLYGIAAPGLRQTCLNAKGRNYECGRVAARALENHIRQANLSCEIREVDAYKRALAVCRNRQEDLGAWMVGQGHAVADRRGPAPYVRNEMLPWGKRLGLWAGAFEDPTVRKRDPYQKATSVADAKHKDEE